MSSIKTTQIDGDVSVGRNVAIGGKADIAGSVSIGHNLKVDGWLEAPNIKGANKGIFLTVQELREAYPVPHDGWMAGVGASTPFTAYVGKGGDWVPTGGTIEVTVDMTEEIEQARDDALSRIGTAGSEAESNVNLAKEDALDAIAEAIEGLEVHYDIETDKGAAKDVQLKDGQGNKLMPRTDAECVEGLDINAIDDYDENEFAIQDGKGHAIVLFSGGHIKTKNFNSKDLEDAFKTIEEDFAIQDETNKAIMMVINGYPVTKNFNGKEIASAAVDSTKTGLYAANDFRGYTIITVGVGRDYATIQEAINSVTNASVNNQYIVLVYDDFYIDDITELWKMSDRTQKISSIADIDGGQTCAYIWTKDYVHVMGVGQRTIHVNLPTDVINSSTRRQYVHNVYHRGSAMLANLKIISQNCRYCIHSEGGSASETSEDFCAVKKFVNLECVYIGHEGGNYQMAWGVGLANGLNITAIGCRFIGKNGAQSGYSHTHPGYKFPATVNIVNCIFDEEGVDGNFDYGELFSGQNSRINIEGSSIHHFNVSYNISLAVNENTDFDVRHNMIQIHGNNNNIRLGAEYIPVLHIDAKNNGDSITSVSGTALNALFIDCLENTPGTPSKPGMWTGCRCIWYSSTNANKSNFASLGYNLGDCSSVNKTLFITVGNHTESVLFDKNYGGLSGTTPIANYSNDEILSEINAQLTYCEIKAVRNMGRLCFDDELMLVYNPSTEVIPMNKLVTIDTSSSMRNAVRVTSADDVVVGVTRYSIQPQAYGYIIKRGKGLLWQTTGVSYGLSNNIKGQLYKAGDNGAIVIAQSKADAYLYGIDASTLVWI